MSNGPRLVKMSGAGNDFLVLDLEESRRVEGDFVRWVRRVCRRGLSIGADGVLLVAPAGLDRVRVDFFNPDGTPAFCGNGSRCAARFARTRGFAGAKMVLQTEIGDLPAEVLGGQVRLTLPAPLDLGSRTLAWEDERLEGRAISAGVPHFVVWTSPVAGAPLALWGPRVRRHPEFGREGSNLDLAARLPGGRLELRTWERGVEGETLACGSGALAAAYALRLEGGPETVTILPASGVPLTVRLPGPASRPDLAILEGDARIVFEGVPGPDATDGFPDRAAALEE
jgi:diaminopimelate epimerase